MPEKTYRTLRLNTWTYLKERTKPVVLCRTKQQKVVDCSLPVIDMSFNFTKIWCTLLANFIKDCSSVTIDEYTNDLAARSDVISRGDNWANKQDRLRCAITYSIFKTNKPKEAWLASHCGSHIWLLYGEYDSWIGKKLSNLTDGGYVDKRM